MVGLFFILDTNDTVYTVNTIYFWYDLQKCFSERILKPNEIFINAIYTKKNNYIKQIFHEKDLINIQKK